MLAQLPVPRERLSSGAIQSPTSEIEGFQFWFFFPLLCLLKTSLNADVLDWGAGEPPHVTCALRSQRAVPDKSPRSKVQACLPCSSHFLWESSAAAPQGESDPFQSVRESSPVPVACFPL